MLDPTTVDQIRNTINKQIRDIKDHICYGVETESQLMYARGRLSGLETICFRILKTCIRRITMVQLIKPKLTDFGNDQKRSRG